MFHGSYGDLSTVEAAKRCLEDIAKRLTPAELYLADNLDINLVDRYAAIQEARRIEGLQQVLKKNGYHLPNTWLPDFTK